MRVKKRRNVFDYIGDFTYSVDMFSGTVKNNYYHEEQKIYTALFSSKAVARQE
jgi:hypothetical protein